MNLLLKEFHAMQKSEVIIHISHQVCRVIRILQFLNLLITSKISFYLK